MRDLVLRIRRGGEPDPVTAAMVAAGITLAATVVLLVVGGGVLMGLTVLPGPGLAQLTVPAISPFLAGCFLLGPAAGSVFGGWWAWDGESDTGRPGDPRPDLVIGTVGAGIGLLILVIMVASVVRSHLSSPWWQVGGAVTVFGGLGAALPWLVHRAPAMRPAAVAGALYLPASMVVVFVARILLVPGLSAAQPDRVLRAARHAAALAPWVAPLLGLLAGAAGAWAAGWLLPPDPDRGRPDPRWADWVTAGLGPVIMSAVLLVAGIMAFGPRAVLHGAWPSLPDVGAVAVGGLVGAWLASTRLPVSRRQPEAGRTAASRT